MGLLVTPWLPDADLREKELFPRAAAFLCHGEGTPFLLNHHTKWEQESLALPAASRGWLMGWWQPLMERTDGLHCTSYCLLTPRWITLIRSWTQRNRICIGCLYFVCQAQWLSCLYHFKDLGSLSFSAVLFPISCYTVIGLNTQHATCSVINERMITLYLLLLFVSKRLVSEIQWWCRDYCARALSQ